MSQASEQPIQDLPQFEPSPRPDQSVPLPPAGSAPRAAGPAPKPVAVKSSPASLISNTLLMVVGGALAAGGYGLARVYAPPRPPGEVAGPAADMVKSDDLKKLTDRVDKLVADGNQTKKQQETDRPDYGPQLKSLNDRLTEVTQTVAQLPAQFDSINQKLGTVSKIEDSNSPNRVEGISKQVSDLSHGLDTLRTDVASLRGSSRGAGESTRVEAKSDAPALNEAIDLFKAKKYPEARGAFVKLQAITPDDARVWYYSALANGFASGQWRGETERMVATGLDKEKAGQPASARVDATFADLTTATGKDWLAGYRKRINAQ